MDEGLARRLEEMNRGFYARQAQSFSDTRQNPWPGWGRCLESVGDALLGPGARVLDVACGNMRFERFLAMRGQAPEAHVLAVDSCDALAAGADLRDCAAAGLDVSFAPFDVLEALRGEDGLAGLLGESAYDLVACFGFFHHVPGADARARLAGELCRLAAPGGFVLVSLWRFASDPSLLARAIRTTEEACSALGLSGLEEDDYILGWNGKSGEHRYCHSFSDDEVRSMGDVLPEDVIVVDRFNSDGRTGGLNAYLVLRRSC